MAAASTYEYVMSLTDRVSGSLQKITGSSSATISRLTSLSDKSKALQRSTSDLGGSISTLKQKIDLLQTEKEMINPANMAQIKQYNREIDYLSGKINKIEGAGRGGALKKAVGQLDSVTGGLFTNPVAWGAAAVGGLVFGAAKHSENMAKVNVTAQLDESGLLSLSDRILQITEANKADIRIAPVGFEKIISQVGEVDRSLEILDAVQKGSKGGFVEMDVAAGALAQTMSIVGKSANALEILDTFFAAKRVGAGEFKDFAQYMPDLIAGASGLGIAYKDVAGMYAYMTGKGQSAEKAAVLMKNAFTVLGRGEVQTAMKKAGVQIFDTEGKMRSMIDIARDLNSVMVGKSDKQKSNLLEGVGLRDSEAKNAFLVLTSDVDKLEQSMTQVRDSVGETSRAVDLSANPVQKFTEIWNTMQLMATKFGEKILPVVNVGLDILGGTLDNIYPVLGGVVEFFGSWSDKLAEGNPLVWGLTAVVIAATAALSAHKVMLLATTLATKSKTVWDATATTATAIWTGQQWGLNAALYACPITWIVLGIGALSAAVVWAWNRFEGFRKVVMGSWECVKMLGTIIGEGLVGMIRNAIGGIGDLGSSIWELFSGNFEQAARLAKNGAQKLFDAQPLVVGAKIVTGLTQADWAGAYQGGAQKWADSWAKDNASSDPVVPEPPAAIDPLATTSQTGSVVPESDFDQIMKSLNGKKGKGSSTAEKDTFSLNGVRDLKGSTAYNTILSKLAPVRLAGLAAAASVGMIMPSLQADSMALPSSPQEQMVDNATTYSQPNRGTSFERFCDQLVVNIQSANGKGYDQIKQEIVSELTKALDNHGA